MTGVIVPDMVDGLTDRVGGALIPSGAVRRLLSGQDIHETTGKHAEPVGLVNVPVQGLRIVLGQDEDPVDIGINTITDRNIYESVFPGYRYRRLGTN